jgi:hypothetical protein
LAKVFSPSNKIQGFVYEAQDPVVIISGKEYRAGDRIGDYTVLKITRDTVYLKRGHWIDTFVTGDMAMAL